MKHIILGLYLLLLAVSSWAEDSDSFYTVETRIGLVEVKPSYEAGPPDEVTLHGKAIFHATGNRNFISIRGYFPAKKSDVVLISLGCACSDGIPDELVFLILKKDKKAKAISNKDFYSADNTIRPIQSAKNIVVDLGFEAGKRKSAELKSEKIFIRRNLVHRVSLKDIDCKAMYEALNECKSTSKDQKPCNRDISDTFSRSLMNNLRVYSDNPSFVPEKWNDACIATCNGKEIDFENFKNSVCRGAAL